MKKCIVLICLCMGLIGFNSCANDDPVVMEGNFGSKIEIGDDYKISTFMLPHNNDLLNEGVKEIVVVLRSFEQGQEEEIELNAQVTVSKDVLLISVKIPVGLQLKDGNYKLSLKSLDNTKFARFFHVRFKNEMLCQVTSEGFDYSFSKTAENKEDGSETNPYTINNKDDFFLFLAALMSDSTSAKGLHFLQKVDLEAPNSSSVVDGMQYYGEAFAGCYDGGEKTIRYVYSGQENPEKASNVGLFTRLKDGAVIKNLKLGVNITGGYSKVGGLTGEASGNIKLENIRVQGSIKASNEYIGGLIGYMSNGVLTVDDCILDMSVETSNRFAGGLAGGVDDCSLNIKGLKTNNVDDSSNPTAFSVKASTYVGGVVGTMGNTAFSLEDVNLKHTVDGETSKLEVVTSESSGVGGLFGQSIRQSGDCSLKNVKVQCPVRLTGSAKYCGGLIGHLKLNKKLVVQQCASTSIVIGDESVGGMIGEVNMESGGDISLEGVSKNHVCVSSSAVSSVKGRESIGGFIGAFKNGTLTIGNLEIATDITGSENNVGGLIGYLESTTIKVENSTLLDANMTVKGETHVGGLFGYANKTALQGPAENNVIYTNNEIPQMDTFHDQFSGKVEGNLYVGGVLGYLTGDGAQLGFFSVDGTVVYKDSYAEEIGGILGRYAKDGVVGIWDCVFKGKVNSNGGKYTGGIVGCWNSQRSSQGGKIQDCINWGEVLGGDATGGIVGYLRYECSQSYHIDNYNILDCVNASRLESSGIQGNVNVGGIIGYALNEDERSPSGSGHLNIERCANYDKVSSDVTGEGAVGGIAGRAYGLYIYIKNSVNHGTIEGNGDYLAGIVAKFGKDPHGLEYGNGNGHISESCNKGTIKGNATYIGGIVGFLEEGTEGSGKEDSSKTGAVFNCYNSGMIENSDAGGIVGYAEGESNIYCNFNSGRICDADGYGYGIVADGNFGFFERDPQCYGNYYISGNSKKGETGEAISSDDAGNQSKFKDWDFSTVWQIGTNGYPILKNCKFQHSTL